MAFLSKLPCCFSMINIICSEVGFPVVGRLKGCVTRLTSPTVEALVESTIKRGGVHSVWYDLYRKVP